jgi:hypothetical protein
LSCAQREYRIKSSDFLGLSLRGHGFGSRLFTLTIQAEGIELAVESRAPDLQPARHLRHLPPVMGYGIPNDVGLELFERPHIAIDVE